jgi:hypothetical protein
VAIPLATLHTRIRARCDLQDTNYLGDTLLTEWALEGYWELWDIMLGAMGQDAPWRVKPIQTIAGLGYVDVPSAVINIATGAGTSDDLADDIFRLYRVEWDGGVGNWGCWEPLRRGNFTSDARLSTARAWGQGVSVKYYARRGFRTLSNTVADSPALGGSQHPWAWRIHWDTPPNAVYNLQLWYVPPPPVVWRTYSPTAVPTVVAYPDEYPEYVTAYCAARACEKSEQDPTPFLTEVSRITDRIQRFLTPTDYGGAQTISDLRRQQGERPEDPFWDRRR